MASSSPPRSRSPKRPLDAEGVAREFIPQVCRSGRLLQKLPWVAQKNMSVVLAAVRADGSALEFACPELRDNDIVVRAAVMCRGAALAHASHRLRDDLDIAHRAVRQHGMAVRYVSRRLQRVRAVARAAVQQCPKSLVFLPEYFRNDQDMLAIAVSKDLRPFTC